MNRWFEEREEMYREIRRKYAAIEVIELVRFGVGNFK